MADGGGCFPTGQHYPGIAHLLRLEVAGLAREHAGETAFAALPVVSIDTETTGRDAATDRIVELALVYWRDGKITGSRSWLINPERPIPREVFEVHGIGDDDVRDQPRFADVAREIAAALADFVPLAYNAEFDRGFLLAEMQRVGIGGSAAPPTLRQEVEWLDPLVWARELQAAEKSRTLVDVCARLGIELEQAHRATFDAEAALRVMVAFTADPRVPTRYDAILQQQRRHARAQDDRMRFWRR